MPRQEFLILLCKPDQKFARESISNPDIAKKVETELATYKLEVNPSYRGSHQKSAYDLEPIKTLLARLKRVAIER